MTDELDRQDDIQEATTSMEEKLDGKANRVLKNIDNSTWEMEYIEGEVEKLEEAELDIIDQI